MHKKQVLLIGSGFIGHRVAKQLAMMNYEVVIASRSTGHDIRDKDKMFDLIREFQAKKVILMAAIADLNVFEADPKVGLDVNIGGVMNVTLACHKFFKKLYYISTCCVYGNTRHLPSTEDAEVNPSEIYAACKVAGEWIVKGFAKSYAMEYVNLRIATTYGPEMRKALAPAIFINQIAKGEPITIHGNGEQTRTMTYIDDEVKGICLVVDSKISNDTVNISSEEEISVNTMVQIIKEEMGKPDHPVIFVTDRFGQTYREKIYAGKAWKLAGWGAEYSFREGIKRTLEWMRANNFTTIP